MNHEAVAALFKKHPPPWHMAMSSGSHVDENPDYFDECDIEDACGRTVASGVDDSTADLIVSLINAMAH